MKTQTCDFGFLAAPEEGPAPGLVLVHDVWGLSDHTRDISQRLAAEGFSVLAIDLYRTMPSREIGNPGTWIQELSDPDIVADIHAAGAFLAAHPDSAGAKIGLVGFCMGGMYALHAACDGRDTFVAAVSFYGMLSYSHGLMQREGGLDPAKKPRDPIAAARDLSCPLLALFGTEDPYIPLDDIATLERELATTSIAHDCVTYEGVGHAFMNDTNADAYRPDAALDAWARMTAFLKAHLEL
ncbi:MAG: dienelactone hydrolase family protein [bacterium]|nr:dienelactone hydrolase family protein [bacterium]